MLKITDIYIKMQSTHDYVQCELINREQFAIKSKDPTRYADNQPESEPFAML
ncbi:MAG: hypothetical protein GY861_24520 [bacterium]|nr:hypothetical protein [bacterium]